MKKSDLAIKLSEFLRKCADVIERGDVDAFDAHQALFRADTYTIDCPISEAAGTGRPGNREHAAILDELDRLASELAKMGR